MCSGIVNLNLSYPPKQEHPEARLGSLLAKCNIKKVYRNVSVHLYDRYLLGMYFEGQIYVDTALPFELTLLPSYLLLQLLWHRSGGLSTDGESHVLYDEFMTLGKAGTGASV